MWGACCAGISPVGLVSEFLLSVVLFPDQVDCVLSAGSLGLVVLSPFSEGDQLRGWGAVRVLSTTLSGWLRVFSRGSWALGVFESSRYSVLW